MSDRDMGLAGPGIMLLSAAIFGYFGFSVTWLSTSASTGQFLFFVALLEWTLKGCAVAFGISAIITLAQPWLGNMIFSGVGLLSAISLVVVMILDILDKQHQAISPFLLAIFAIWNGLSSWAGIKAALATPPKRPELFEP